MRYTTDDIISKEVQYEYRKYKSSGMSYEVQQGIVFSTDDGKYRTTHPDCQGYSYWTLIRKDMEDVLIGNIGTDYIFGIEQGKIDAVNVLNRLIKEN